jgi:HAD superfamily hydrolase (TIGR01549 family)
MPITAVVFDVGETLIDETRHWGEWADWMGAPRLTFFAVLGAVIARGEHHRRVFEMLRPGFDLEAETERRAAAGWAYQFEPGDFYPDALPCLAALRARGLKVGLAGNQPDAAEAALEAAGAPADFIASSARWGVEKPNPAFFAKVIEAAATPAGEIAYVGDRVDNDVSPARAAGMTAVFLRRGPWAFIQTSREASAGADIVLDSLDDLIPALDRQNLKEHRNG